MNELLTLFFNFFLSSPLKPIAAAAAAAAFAVGCAAAVLALAKFDMCM
jgi:hypothetical protein